MENALLVGLSRQVALARELDVVANNIANVNTNGFKRRSMVFNEFVSPTASADSFPRRDRAVSFVLDKGSTLAFTQGDIEQTGNPLDVAVRGNALLAVRTAAGTERYTRNGAFALNGRGELVTSDGFAVQTDQGPVTFTDQDANIRIAADGTVSSSQGTKGKLKLVVFDNPQTLRNEGQNLFSSTATPRPATGDETRIEQGAVEKSNVQPVTEMTRLIELSRSYQEIANMMSRADELSRTAINRLADQQA